MGKFKKTYSKKFRKKRNTLAKKVAKLSKFVYTTIEQKQTIDVNRPTAVISDGQWGFQDLTLMKFNTGARNDMRIGNAITLENIQLKIMIEDWQADLLGRFIIVQFPVANEAVSALNVGHFLQFPETGTAAFYATSWDIDETHVVNSPYKVGSEVKYTILYDKIFNLKDGATTNVAPYGQLQRFNININKRNNPRLNTNLKFIEAPGALSPNQGRIVCYFRLTDMDFNIGTPQSKDLSYIYRMTYRDS